MTETIKRKLSDSSAARWTAMLIVSFTMMCGYFITDVMSPLGDMLTRSVVDGHRPNMAGSPEHTAGSTSSC